MTDHKQLLLDWLEVEARFATPAAQIEARSRDADDYLAEPRDCDAGRSLRNRGRRLRLPAEGISCLAYKVDLAGAADEQRYNRSLTDNNVIHNPVFLDGIVDEMELIFAAAFFLDDDFPPPLACVFDINNSQCTVR